MRKSRRAALQEAAAYQERVRNDSWSGVKGGLIAGVLLAVAFFLYDLLRFEPLATPTAMADLLAAGGEGTSALFERTSTMARVLWFTVVHLAVFGAVGLGAAWFFRMTGYRKSIWLGAIYGLVICSAAFEGGLRLTGTTMSAVPRWPAILISNLIAGAVIVFYMRLKEVAI